MAGRLLKQVPAGYRMPAEWEPHAATWLAYPHHRTDWPGKLSAIPLVFAEMARLLTEGERVRLLVADAAERSRAERVFERAGVRMDRVDLVLAPTNRSWTRDYAPLFVKKGRARGGAAGRTPAAAGPLRHPAGSLVAVKFRFDGWARYRDHHLDDAAGVRIARGFASEYVLPRLPDGRAAVLEGGSIDVDGQGTLLTTEECLLTSPRSRNRGLGREGTEQLLAETLGVRQVIWLPNGVAGDDTSGHVDDFARFVGPGRVVVCDEPDRRDVNHAPLRAAQKVLQSARDARGRALDVIQLPMPRPVTYGGVRLPASYANFYIGNAAVLVPLFNDPRDRDALNILSECFPKRPVVGVYARDLVLGLGTLHCSTMQEPL
ncbi:MAG: agmatine deiminase family protein [Myxococcales bacterium]|jgi:agmatine deiminase|nr:agmatine deiminase family protein [Myxococcales bacterium]